MLAKYALQYAASLLKTAQPVVALKVFMEHGAPSHEANWNVYRKLVLDLCSLRDPVAYTSWAGLRDRMFEVMSDLRRQGVPQADEFEKYVTMAHYYALRAACDDAGEGPLTEIGTKLSMSMLRHTDIVPADRGFYEAGMTCNKIGWEGMAFVFLNRYLDLSEAITEQDLGGLDNSDFVGTDVPFEVPLPQEQFLSDEKREEVHEFVLSSSVDRNIDQELTKDARGTYVASLTCENTSKVYDACIVTGWPVLSNQYKFGGKTANKEDWNRLMMASKTTGDTELSDVMKFLAAWAGATEAPVYSFN